MRYGENNLQSPESQEISQRRIMEQLNSSQELGIDVNEDIDQLQKVVPILVPILFSIIILIGFFGNILVVLIIYLNKTMRNTTNLLILNLAVFSESS